MLGKSPLLYYIRESLLLGVILLLTIQPVHNEGMILLAFRREYVLCRREGVLSFQGHDRNIIIVAHKVLRTLSYRVEAYIV